MNGLRSMGTDLPNTGLRNVTSVSYTHLDVYKRQSQFGAVATVEPKPGACVPVLVWKLRPSDERALDLYEGYPHLYRKENLSVTMDGGERDIMAYVMTGEREYGVPARSYYETIARGYADAGRCV